MEVIWDYNPVNVLIGCEESQAVCKAFRAAGHNAYSCDLKVSSGGHPEWHIVGDVLEVMRGGELVTESGDVVVVDRWGMIGLHPVCTKMTLSGNRHYAPGKARHQERLESVEWTIALWQQAIALSDFVYMENPMGAMNGDRRLPRPQIVQPYYFGDEYQKTTCLWLHGLSQLLHCEQDNLFEKKTHVGRGEFVTFESGKRHPKWYADALKETPEMRRELRSKSFPGIANAMSSQWGNLIN